MNKRKNILIAQVGMISTLLISPYLGAWVDLTPRLRAATTLTVVQVETYLESLANWLTPCVRVQLLLCPL